MGPSVAVDRSSPLSSELVTELRCLPVCSAAAGRALALVDDPSTSAADIARVLETDPALVTRLLLVANSAHYGLPRRVGNVQTAVAVVGFSTVRGLVAAAALGLVGDDDDLMPDGFWDHALTTAAVALVVARHVLPSAQPDAFGAALLHDIGAALLHRLRPQVHRLLTAAAADEDELVGMERESLGIDHAEAGGLALEALQLPEALVDAVRHHHEPTGRPLASVVSAADQLARWLDAGGADEVPEKAVAVLGGLHLAGSRLVALTTELRQVTSEAVAH